MLKDRLVLQLENLGIVSNERAKTEAFFTWSIACGNKIGTTLTMGGQSSGGVVCVQIIFSFHIEQNQSYCIQFA